jgi:hypothetical protein
MLRLKKITVLFSSRKAGRQCEGRTNGRGGLQVEGRSIVTRWRRRLLRLQEDLHATVCSQRPPPGANVTKLFTTVIYEFL